MSIPVWVKRMFAALLIGITSNAAWAAIQHTWAALGLNLHTAIQLAFFVAIAAIGVFAGGYITDHRKDVLISQLRQELRERKRRRLEELATDADYIWNTRTESKSQWWMDLRQQWTKYAVSGVADFLNTDRITAEKRLINSPAMENHTETEYLSRHMQTLKTILDTNPMN
jgi:hypothetical protein